MFPDFKSMTDTQLEMIAGLTESRCMKISKDDLRMSEEQLLWSDELEKEVVDYWTELNKWWTEKKLPPCTCADKEGGFLAREKYNPFYYNNTPCSVDWYNKCKSEGLIPQGNEGKK